jgi:hypothetical protein
MSSVFPFVTRRRFLAFLGVPALLALARCAPARRTPRDRESYVGSFFSDGSDFRE